MPACVASTRQSFPAVREGAGRNGVRLRFVSSAGGDTGTPLSRPAGTEWISLTAGGSPAPVDLLGVRPGGCPHRAIHRHSRALDCTSADRALRVLCPGGRHRGVTTGYIGAAGVPTTRPEQ